jgi:hypothetical protein
MAERGFRVTGIDSSPTLISLCRQRLPDHEWLVADMRSLQLPRQFDGVLAWDSFFHLTPDDQRWMFNVFAWHSGPSAVLMFNSGPAHGEGVGEYRGDPLYHASLSPDEYTSLLSSIGFEVVVHAVEDWQTGGGRTVWLNASSCRSRGFINLDFCTVAASERQKERPPIQATSRSRCTFVGHAVEVNP